MLLTSAAAVWRTRASRPRVHGVAAPLSGSAGCRCTRVRGCGPAAARARICLAALPATLAVAAAQRAQRRSGLLVEYAARHPRSPAARRGAPRSRLGCADRCRLAARRFLSPGRASAGQRCYTGGCASYDADPPARHRRRAGHAARHRGGHGAATCALPARQRLRVRIWTGRVENVSTIADGDRFGDADRRGAHQPPRARLVREGSPVRRGRRRRPAARPTRSRTTRAAVAPPGPRASTRCCGPGEMPGAARLDYHVAEQKPWLVVRAGLQHRHRRPPPTGASASGSPTTSSPATTTCCARLRDRQLRRGARRVRVVRGADLPARSGVRVRADGS